MERKHRYDTNPDMEAHHIYLLPRLIENGRNLANLPEKANPTVLWLEIFMCLPVSFLASIRPLFLTTSPCRGI